MTGNEAVVISASVARKLVLPSIQGWFCLTAQTALAHGFVGNGILHPLTGWDHVLAMLAVGAWSAQLGGAALYLIPSTFVIAMAAGGAIAVFLGPLPGTETLIAVSVLGLGFAIALDRRLAWPVAALTTLSFGLAHGSAHGAEVPQAADPVSYVVGFLVTTAGLHVTGAVASLLLLECSIGRKWLRLAGATAAVSGLALLSARYA